MDQPLAGHCPGRVGACWREMILGCADGSRVRATGSCWHKYPTQVKMWSSSGCLKAAISQMQGRREVQTSGSIFSRLLCTL